MSSHSTERITCQACGHVQDFTVWSSLNTSLDPDAKQRLIDGGLLTFKCAQCGDTARVEYNLLYHDMDAHWMVWLLPSGDWPEPYQKDTPPFNLFKETSQYRLRVVRSFNELLEKVYVADSKLDDFAIEVIKLMLWQNIREEEGIDDGILLFAGTQDGDEGKELTFILLSEHKKGRFSIPYAQFYGDLVREYEETFEKVAQEPLRWIQVDAAYALQKLENNQP